MKVISAHEEACLMVKHVPYCRCANTLILSENKAQDTHQKGCVTDQLMSGAAFIVCLFFSFMLTFWFLHDTRVKREEENNSVSHAVAFTLTRPSPSAMWDFWSNTFSTI